LAHFQNSDNNDEKGSPMDVDNESEDVAPPSKSSLFSDTCTFEDIERRDKHDLPSAERLVHALQLLPRKIVKHIASFNSPKPPNNVITSATAIGAVRAVWVATCHDAASNAHRLIIGDFHTPVRTTTVRLSGLPNNCKCVQVVPLTWRSPNGLTRSVWIVTNQTELFVTEIPKSTDWLKVTSTLPCRSVTIASAAGYAAFLPNVCKLTVAQNDFTEVACVTAPALHLTMLSATHTACTTFSTDEQSIVLSQPTLRNDVIDLSCFGTCTATLQPNRVTISDSSVTDDFDIPATMFKSMACDPVEILLNDDALMVFFQSRLNDVNMSQRICRLFHRHTKEWSSVFTVSRVSSLWFANVIELSTTFALHADSIALIEFGNAYAGLLSLWSNKEKTMQAVIADVRRLVAYAMQWRTAAQERFGYTCTDGRQGTASTVHFDVLDELNTVFDKLLEVLTDEQLAACAPQSFTTIMVELFFSLFARDRSTAITLWEYLLKRSRALLDSCRQVRGVGWSHPMITRETKYATTDRVQQGKAKPLHDSLQVQRQRRRSNIPLQQEVKLSKEERKSRRRRASIICSFLKSNRRNKIRVFQASDANCALKLEACASNLRKYEQAEAMYAQAFANESISASDAASIVFPSCTYNKGDYVVVFGSDDDDSLHFWMAQVQEHFVSDSDGTDAKVSIQYFSACDCHQDLISNFSQYKPEGPLHNLEQSSILGTISIVDGVPSVEDVAALREKFQEECKLREQRKEETRRKNEENKEKRRRKAEEEQKLTAIPVSQATTVSRSGRVSTGHKGWKPKATRRSANLKEPKKSKSNGKSQKSTSARSARRRR
jgi:hypothetical protein